MSTADHTTNGNNKVNTWAYMWDAGPDDPNWENTTIDNGLNKDKDGNTPDKVLVKYTDGNFYPVQARYSIEDGSTAVLIIPEETDAQGEKIQTPIVLYTQNKDGKITTGGTGRPDIVGVEAIQQYHITSPAQAEAFLATAVTDPTSEGGDNESMTLQEVYDQMNARQKKLYEQQLKEWEAEYLDSRGELLPLPDGVTPRAKPVPPAEAKDPTVQDGAAEEEPEVGDVDTGDTNTNTNNNTGPQFDEVFANFSNFVEGLVINDEDIKRIEEKLNDGGGTLPVEQYAGGQVKYPEDASYGREFGQDYVYIEQFQYQPPRKDQIFVDNTAGALKNLTEGSRRQSALKKFIASIRLPMPNTLTDSNNVAWGQDEMNNLSAAIVSGALKNPAAVAGGALVGGSTGLFGLPGFTQLGALAGLMGSGTKGDGKGFLDNIKANMENIAKSDASVLVKSAVGSRIISMAGVQASPESLLSRGLGVVPNSNMELLFNSPTLREFQFSWKMSPRSREEARIVRLIVRFFKQGMAARTISGTAGDRSLFLGTPNVFRLSYRTAGGIEIEGVNKIKPCAVTGTSVNYTPDGTWAAYEGGQPVSTTLSIRMQELEPIYANDYNSTNIANQRNNDVNTDTIDFNTGIGPINPDRNFNEDGSVGDLRTISDTEVGY